MQKFCFWVLGFIGAIFIFCLVVFICALINNLTFLDQLKTWFGADIDKIKDTAKVINHAKSIIFRSLK